MKKSKIILVSLSLFASAATLAPIASPVFAAKSIVTENKTANAKAEDVQTIKMTITKTGTDKPSDAAMFLGKNAEVTVKDGKIVSVKIHVDGSTNPRTKGQNMAKMVASFAINGVKGEQKNIAQDGSSLDFIFPASAYKEGKGTVEFQINAMGHAMDEKADITFDKVILPAADKTAKKTTKKAKTSHNKTVKKAKQTKHVKKAKKARKVKRTLKHNAYIYKKNGKRANKKVLKKHHRVNTYGRAIKLHGKYFYRISKNTYVKRANF
ncbi:MAG: SLAP domain-containing protein [Candidatus Lactobacillus pullistercoris]|uniref:SLAP domain-containing protein n=1 Tax=Candidatus Lactobacillus pullistercoris TaxID=2838636 RepID=A0A9E2KR03_9LACO|nr:SLAP domain-containing protein [Candidatus Lactobacillus pullistercoris]